VKLPDIKAHANPIYRSGAVSCAQTDRQTDRHGQQSHFAIFGSKAPSLADGPKHMTGIGKT